jgi:hypothetical protein
MIISFWQLELGPDGAEIHTSTLSPTAAILTSFLWYLVEVFENQRHGKTELAQCNNAWFITNGMETVKSDLGL